MPKIKKMSAQAWKLGGPLGHGREAQKSCKREAFKPLVRIPLQMARKCHFEAAEGRDQFWVPGPGLRPGGAK